MGSHGGKASPSIFYYMEYVYILCEVTGVSYIRRIHIPLREYVYAVCSRGGEDSPGIFLCGTYIYIYIHTSCVA